MLQQSQKACPTFSSVWIMAMNVVYAIFGIIFISLSSWGIENQKKSSQLADLPTGALNALVAAGVFLLFIAISGCLGVKYNNKVFGRYLLGCYAALMVLVMIMEFAASVTIFSYVGHLDSVVPTEALNVVKGDYGAFMLVNQSFFQCCCGKDKCPQPALNMTRDFCWIPKTEPYPCQGLPDFARFVEDYIRERVEPVAYVAFFLCLLQLFTSIVACCNQCQGRKQQEKDKISGPMSYDGLDGMYGEGEEAYTGGDNAYKAYAGYVKSGAVGRPGSAAALPAPGAGAAAPPAPPRPGGAPPPAPPRK